MADEDQREPAERPGDEPGERSGPWDGGPGADRDPGELDETRPHEPFRDTGEPADTAESPRPSADDTVAVPRPPGDETTVLPPAQGDRWTARAGIPPATAPEAGSAEDYDGDPGRGWWVPALLGLVALLLLGLLGVGIWLIMRNRAEPATPEPTGTPSVVRTTRSAPPATSAAPPPTSAAATVAVPVLLGLRQADAQQVLEAVGLTYRVTERVDPNAAPGTVIGVDPPTGAVVPVGSRVNLVVAVAPPTTAAPTSAAPNVSPSGG